MFIYSNWCICISFMVCHYLIDVFLLFSEGILPFNPPYWLLAPPSCHTTLFLSPHQLQCIGREMRLKAKIQKYENVQKKPSLASHVTSSLFKAFNKTSTRQVITKVLKYRMLVFQSFWYWRTLRLKFINKHFLDCLYNKITQFLTKNYLLPGH